MPALGVVTEAMMALVLANEALRKFGGDSVEEFTRNHAPTSRISARPPRPLVPSERGSRSCSSVCRASARRRWPARSPSDGSTTAVDTDDLLAAAVGTSAAQYLRDEGETTFRARELEALAARPRRATATWSSPPAAGSSVRRDARAALESRDHALARLRRRRDTGASR